MLADWLEMRPCLGCGRKFARPQLVSACKWLASPVQRCDQAGAHLQLGQHKRRVELRQLPCALSDYVPALLLTLAVGEQQVQDALLLNLSEHHTTAGAAALGD